eukprot:3517262-Prymnesium_polylepis.2
MPSPPHTCVVVGACACSTRAHRGGGSKCKHVSVHLAAQCKEVTVRTCASRFSPRMQELSILASVVTARGDPQGAGTELHALRALASTRHAPVAPSSRCGLGVLERRGSWESAGLQRVLGETCGLKQARHWLGGTHWHRAVPPA